MANNSRGVQDYAAVPQSPRAGPGQPYVQARPPSSTPSVVHQGRGSIAQGVATGTIGGGFGPYSYNPQQAMHDSSRFSAAPSEMSSLTADKTGFADTSSVPQYLWDKDPELDDALHNPRDGKQDSSFTLFSARGWLNVGALVILLGGLIMLFAGYPIMDYYSRATVTTSGFNLGGINASGQVPDLPGLPTLIDDDTPSSAYSRTGSDGKKYNLVFSDEFNLDGRTFYPGEDPFWEAQDMHYWPTGDLEWYDPSAATTKDGKLVLTMTQEDIHDLNWKSGMLSGWNKLCFNTGYIEVSLSLPGSADAPGFWPGVWTMGNLGRAGFGATNEGMWPYSYDSCDLGALPNQTDAEGNPEAAATGNGYGDALSWLPGQRTSACTCSGEDHPGPSTGVGRGVPEIDIIEAQIDVSVMQGEVSQSYQVAPFNYEYQIDNSSSATTIYDDDITAYNSYKGGNLQQAVSAVTYIDRTLYDGNAYGAFGVEWYSDPDNRDDGFIQWTSDGSPSWKITSATIGADDTAEISSRLISEEPMYIILNLGISPSFQAQDYKHMVFPAHMYIDYVRVYQRAGTKNGLSCSPPNRPTADYIADHINAYSNPNLTTWSQAGYDVPLSSLKDGC